MKLLVIFPSTERGGAEEYTLTLATAAVQAGWDVHAAFPEANGTTSLRQDFTRANIAHSPLNISNATDHSFSRMSESLLRFTRTLSLLLRLKPDAVLVVLPYPPLAFTSLLACGLLAIPTAVVFQLVPFKFEFGRRRLQTYAWARARNQQWITVSKHNQTLISQTFHIPPEALRCVYNGISLPPSPIQRTDVEPEVRDQVRRELGIPEHGQILLTVARLHSQKGYSYLIPIIPTLITAFPNVMFVWVGEGDQRDLLMQQVQDQGVREQVLFLGYRSDIPRLLQAADLFIFPSYFEGLPFAVMEAMIYGLPIVASDTGGIPELIEHGQQGLLCRTGDSQDLLAQTQWALGHPERMQEMAKQAQRRVLDFSQATMIQDMLGTLESLCHANPKG